MRLFKLTFIKRLFLALALSIFVVFSLALIFWSLESANGLKVVDVDHGAYDFDEEIDYLNRLDRAIDAAVSSKSISKFDQSTSVLVDDDLKKETEPKPDLISYLWNSIIGGAGTAFVLIAVGFFVLLSTINQFFNEDSIGWKRLSLASSSLITLLTGIYFYVSNALMGDDVFLILLAFPISLTILLYSKVIYVWIKDGFKADKA